MTDSFFNSLDYFYISLTLISCLIGFFRGFIKDFFSTCSWLGSGFASAFTFPYVADHIQKNGIIYNPAYAKIVAIVFSFVVILIVLKLAVGIVSKTVKSTALSELDRAFGALYGLIRGFLILIALCIFAIIFNVLDMKREFIANSKITPLLIDSTSCLLPKIISIQKASRKFTSFPINKNWLQNNSVKETERLAKEQPKKNTETPPSPTGEKDSKNYLTNLISKFSVKKNSSANVPQTQRQKEFPKVKNRNDSAQSGYVDLMKARARRKAQKKAERIRRDLMKSLDNKPR